MSGRTPLLLATRNRGKVREVLSVLAGLPVEFITLEAFPDVAEPVEEADTFEGNAAHKAVEYARATGLWSLADDSGLEVDALGGAPGVHSARYAGRQGDDAANNARLVAELTRVGKELRSARFRCVVALADRSGVLATGCGVFEGVIVDEPKGVNGFGYDPHFFVPQFGMTSAQMPAELKNAVSHRAQALQAIRPQIIRLLTPSPTR